MGGDGGSIPTRCELVKEKKEPEKKNRDQDMVGKWQHCALSGHPLVKPIVSCGLGRLYNKEAIINHILDKGPKTHIRKLADVRELKLTVNVSYNTKDHQDVRADTYIDHYTAPYVCPTIGLEMSGRYRFVYNWKCGCVVSERAVIEIPSETCHQCGELNKDNIIVINGTEDDIKLLRERLNRLKQDKKAKKIKTTDQPTDRQSSKSKKHLLDNQTANGSNKKVKASSSSEPETKDKFKETSSYKKLFHKNSQPKDKAHWVTYNPYYN